MPQLADSSPNLSRFMDPILSEFLTIRASRGQNSAPRRADHIFQDSAPFRTRIRSANSVLTWNLRSASRLAEFSLRTARLPRISIFFASLRSVLVCLGFTAGIPPGGSRRLLGAGAGGGGRLNLAAGQPRNPGVARNSGFFQHQWQHRRQRHGLHHRRCGGCAG